MDDAQRKALEDKLRKELAELDRQEKELINQQQNLKIKEDQLKYSDSPKQPEPIPKPAQPVLPIDTGPSFNRDDLIDGVTYLLLDEDGDSSKELFVGVLAERAKGLLISRINPKVLQRKYDISVATICWLSKMRAGDDIKSVYGLQEISIMINSYVEENEKAIVMIDGLEYLISNNDFNIVLRLVQQVRDKVSTTESILLLPINPQVLEAKQITLMKNECETL